MRFCSLLILFAVAITAVSATAKKSPRAQILPDTGLKVGVITWNLADEEDVDNVKPEIAEIFSEITGNRKHPDIDILAIMVQEDKTGYFKARAVQGKQPSLDWFLSKRGLVFRDATHKCDIAIGHGCNSLRVYTRRIPHEIVPHVILGWREKSSVGIKVKVHNFSPSICFISSHFSPGPEAGGTENRQSQLHRSVRETVDSSVLGCDVMFFGGDHNYRNADWTDTTENSLFSDATSINHIRQYYSSLDMSHQFIFAKQYPTPPVLTANYDLSTFQHDLPLTMTLNHITMIPPTFQPIRKKKCAKLLQKSEFRLIGTPVREGGSDGKRAICFETLSGGNCPPHEPTHFCTSATRPLSWTDVIIPAYSTTSPSEAQIVIYGGYYAPTISDHVPVFGVFNVIPRFQETWV